MAKARKRNNGQRLAQWPGAHVARLAKGDSYSSKLKMPQDRELETQVHIVAHLETNFIVGDTGRFPSSTAARQLTKSN